MTKNKSQAGMNKHRFSIFILFLFQLTCIQLYAASPLADLTDLELRSVVLDSTGISWISDQQGLIRFDGRYLMRQDEWEGYEGGEVYCQGVDPGGKLWVHSRGGLYRYEGLFEPVVTHSPELAVRGREMAFSRNAMLLATDHGLVRLDQRGKERVLLSDIFVSSLTLMPDGNLVAGTIGKGLFIFDADGNPAPAPDGFSTLLPSIIDVCARADDKLLVLGQDKKFNPRLVEFDLGQSTSRYLDGFDSLIQEDYSKLKQKPTLLRLPDSSCAIWLKNSWVKIDGSQPGENITASGLHLDWPIHPLEYYLPSLLWTEPVGRFIQQMSEGGVLVEREGEIQIISQPETLAPQTHPVQVLTTSDKLILLLERRDGSRQIVQDDQNGYRVLQPDSKLLAGQQMNTICWNPRIKGGILIGLDDRILLYTDGITSLLTAEFGATWMNRFTDDLILLCGPGGTAFFDGSELRELRIKEAVSIAVNDGFRGILAACDNYLLKLNTLNELDTLAYPAEMLAFSGDTKTDSAASLIRSLQVDADGRFWLLTKIGLFYYSGGQVAWTTPLLNSALKNSAGFVDTEEIISIKRDKYGRIWISHKTGTGYFIPDKIPPVILLNQDPALLNLSDINTTINIVAADPLSNNARLRFHYRIDQEKWSSWYRAGEFKLGDLLPKGTNDGNFRLQLQAIDNWGNLSPTLTLPLYLQKIQNRWPFFLRAGLLLGMVILSVTIALILPGKIGYLIISSCGIAISILVKTQTEEPLLWLALPLVMLVSAKHVNDQIAQRHEKSEELKQQQKSGILELVDLFREFGHSGSSTRNLDRLLRSSRNLYLDGVPDEEISRRFQQARQIFLELTKHSLNAILEVFERLSPRENPVSPSLLEQFREQVRKVEDSLSNCLDIPAEVELEALAFHLSQLETLLNEIERKVDLQISCNPLKVLDMILKTKNKELAGVALDVRCARDAKQMMARIPVDKLQFILDNLIDNALYWMRDRDHSELKVEIIERPSSLRILVSDNGPGIADDQQERIFEAGVSGRSTEIDSNDESQGGYGLYRSRELMARFSGKIELAESTLGKGSIFSLEIKKVEPV
jgi:signal transduction histidine kinase